MAAHPRWASADAFELCRYSAVFYTCSGLRVGFEVIAFAMGGDLHVTQVPVHPPKWAAVDNQNGKAYFPALDGLRGLAILLVVTFHAFNTYYGHGYLMDTLFLFPHLGWIGVPIFFCLSGFLVSIPFWEAREKGKLWLPAHYTAKRIIRIAPSYYLSIVLVALASGLLLGHWKDYLTSGFIWAFGAGLYAHTPIFFNGVYWSLIVEIQFYILLPFLFWSVLRMKPFAALLSVAFFWLALAFICRWVIVSHAEPGTTYGMMEFFLKRYFCHMDLFVLGIVFGFLYYYQKGISQIRAIPYTVLLTALIALGIVGRPFLKGQPVDEIFSWHTFEIRHYFTALSAFVLILVQIYEKSLLYYLFTTRWMVYLGAVSYEWYLVHQPILVYGEHFGGLLHLSFALRLCNSLAFVGIGLLVTIAMHHGFYLPVSAFLRSKFIKKSRVANEGAF